MCSEMKQQHMSLYSLAVFAARLVQKRDDFFLQLQTHLCLAEGLGHILCWLVFLFCQSLCHFTFEPAPHVSTPLPSPIFLGIQAVIIVLAAEAHLKCLTALSPV